MFAARNNDLFGDLFGSGKPLFPRAVPSPAPAVEEQRAPVNAGSLSPAPWRYSYDDGNKFAGGFGYTEVLVPDYWTLRARSAQLFETNLYARGLIRRLVTNEINTGLHLEATPEEKILGRAEGSLAEWSETTETRFALWASNPAICHQAEQYTFGALQAIARQEALVVGDVLVTLRQDPRTRLPRVLLINGASVRTPLDGKPQQGNKITHGVELDAMGRHVAYWVQQEDGTSKRMAAFGEKSGRRIAWLVYGSDKRLDDVRGKPLLSLVLQSLREIDRYRDATQRKAELLANIVGFVAKGEDKPGTRPLTGGGAQRFSQTLATDPAKPARTFKASGQLPGLWIDELEYGEEPKSFQTSGTTETFAGFEEAILSGVAFGCELPPEIYRLTFSSNYSASKAAINELEMYLERTRTRWGDELCQPIYVDWLYSEALNRRIEARELVEAWGDFSRYDEFSAWVSSDWAGQIKPSLDLDKSVRGWGNAVDHGFATRGRAARSLFGLKASRVGKQLKPENELLADAKKPLAELEAASKPAPVPPTGAPPPEPDPTDDEPAPAPNNEDDDQ